MKKAAKACNPMPLLYLTLNSNNDKDLNSLVVLLFKHGFLLP